MGGAGDVWEIATCIRDAGHVKPNSQLITWAVRATSNYSSEGDLDRAWRAALPNLMNVLSDGCQAEGAFYRRWLPTPTTRVGKPFPTAIVGGVDAQELPLACAALVLRQSGLQGRNRNGRLYVPWLPVQYEDPAIPNRLVEINRLAIEQACRDVNSSLQGGSTGTSWTTVTLSRRSLETPGLYATPVTRFTCMRDFRALAQRGRRDYICPFEDRWLAITPFAAFAARRSLGDIWRNATANPLNWRYWLNGGARGGDDGAPDPAWTSPTFAATSWHPWVAALIAGPRICPSTAGPGGVIWPPLSANPNANDPLNYERSGNYHYLRNAPAVPNNGSPYLNDGEQDYYRCTFNVTNVPTVTSATLVFNYLDGVAHWINGALLWNNVGGFDASPPNCRPASEVDILPYLNVSGPNCWAVLHVPHGEFGRSTRRWNKYPPPTPPFTDLVDSWWAGEIRIGGRAFA
jgi:hypothetical protein